MNEKGLSVFEVVIGEGRWEEKLNGIKGSAIGYCSSNREGRKKADGECSRVVVLELDVLLSAAE
jgi:hypothetical protein